MAAETTDAARLLRGALRAMPSIREPGRTGWRLQFVRLYLAADPLDTACKGQPEIWVLHGFDDVTERVYEDATAPVLHGPQDRLVETVTPRRLSGFACVQRVIVPSGRKLAHVGFRAPLKVRVELIISVQEGFRAALHGGMIRSDHLDGEVVTRRMLPIPGAPRSTAQRLVFVVHLGPEAESVVIDQSAFATTNCVKERALRFKSPPSFLGLVRGSSAARADCSGRKSGSEHLVGPIAVSMERAIFHSPGNVHAG